MGKITLLILDVQKERVDLQSKVGAECFSRIVEERVLITSAPSIPS